MESILTVHSDQVAVTRQDIVSVAFPTQEHPQLSDWQVRFLLALPQPPQVPPVQELQAPQGAQKPSCWQHMAEGPGTAGSVGCAPQAWVPLMIMWV